MPSKEIDKSEWPTLAKAKVGIAVTIDASMPDHAILGIVSALSSYPISAALKHNSFCLQRKVKQELLVYMHVNMSDNMVDRELPAILKAVVPCELSINQEPYRKTIEYSQTLVYEDIVALAQPSCRSFAQAAGILIGAEAGSIIDLAPAANSKNKEFTNQALLEDGNICEALQLLLNSRHLMPYFPEPYESSTYLSMLQEVVDSSIVIGPSSFYTYAAACLGIPVIELHKDQSSLDIFSKWSAKKYAAIIEAEADLVNIERLEKLWQSWYPTTTDKVQGSSIVAGADGQ